MPKWILIAAVALNLGQVAAESRTSAEILSRPLNGLTNTAGIRSEDTGEYEDFVPHAEEDQMREYGFDPDEPRFIRINNSRLFVHVNKTTQRITILVDGEPIALKHDKVSTGGTLKIPNNADLGKAPYCGSTPDFIEHFIPAVPAQSLADRYRATVFEKYYSSTFLDDNDRPIAMPHAIRIRGGIFFHAAAAIKIPNLGTNVSGDCVRLHPETAKMLYDLTLQYGGLTTTIEGADPAPKGLACSYLEGRAVEVNAKTGKVTKDPLGKGQLVGQLHPGFANAEAARKAKKAGSKKAGRSETAPEAAPAPAQTPAQGLCGIGIFSSFCQ